VITESDLRAAAAQIGSMPDSDLDRSLSQFKQLLSSRSALAALRQQTELDSAELDQAAYQLARQHQEDGDLEAAVRWYRVAAMSDYADAALQLGRVLDYLAESQLGRPASRVSTREEMDLVSEAARWYAAAYAAGHSEAAEYLDTLIARHDAERSRVICQDPADPDETGPASSACSLGGLEQVMESELTAATSHFQGCQACQRELLQHGGLLPVGRRRPVVKAPPAGLTRESSERPRSLSESGTALHEEPSRSLYAPGRRP
jgi:hypothetical protein